MFKLLEGILLPVAFIILALSFIGYAENCLGQRLQGTYVEISQVIEQALE
jgi:hypothetical protein